MTARTSSADDGEFAAPRRVNISVMSWVVNVVLSFDIEDLDTADGFNHWLAVDAPDREHFSPERCWASWRPRRRRGTCVAWSEVPRVPIVGRGP
jgi:hypothetical protein